VGARVGERTWACRHLTMSKMPPSSRYGGEKPLVRKPAGTSKAGDVVVGLVSGLAGLCCALVLLRWCRRRRFYKKVRLRSRAAPAGSLRLNCPAARLRRCNGRWTRRSWRSRSHSPRTTRRRWPSWTTANGADAAQRACAGGARGSPGSCSALTLNPHRTLCVCARAQRAVATSRELYGNHGRVAWSGRGQGRRRRRP